MNLNFVIQYNDEALIANR